MTVINSRTRGLAPMMMGNSSDQDSTHHASSDESVESENAEPVPFGDQKRQESFHQILV